MTKDTTDRGIQAQKIADMLRSTQTGERTIRDIEDITGMHPDYVRRWLKAFEAVGLIRKGTPRKPARGQSAQTWVGP